MNLRAQHIQLSIKNSCSFNFSEPSDIHMNLRAQHTQLSIKNSCSFNFSTFLASLLQIAGWCLTPRSQCLFLCQTWRLDLETVISNASLIDSITFSGPGRRRDAVDSSKNASIFFFDSAHCHLDDDRMDHMFV